MPKFAVGDRVQSSTSRYGVPKERTEGTVAKIKNNWNICIHFDDPELERKQNFEQGWGGSYFYVVENNTSFIPEDWS